MDRSCVPKLCILKQIRRLFISTLVLCAKTCKLPLAKDIQHQGKLLCAGILAAVKVCIQILQGRALGCIAGSYKWSIDSF